MIEIQEAPQVDSGTPVAEPSGTWTWFDLTIKGLAIAVLLVFVAVLAWVVVKHVR